MKRIFYGLIAFGFLIAPSALAQEFTQRDPVFTFSTGIETTPKLVDSPDDGLIMQHVHRLTTEAEAHFEWRDDAGRKLIVRPFLQKNHYAAVEDELQFGLFAEFRHPVFQDQKSELRWRGGAEHSHDVFTRTTLQATLNTRHDTVHSSQATLRYRYRNQDDARTFSGFDQHEIYASFQQTYFPELADVKRISGTFYGDLRQAAEAQFDYTEFGARMTIRFAASEEWDVTAKARGFIRDYRSKSSGTGVARRDERIALAIEAKYDLGDMQNLLGGIGWEANQSSLSTRTFSGPVVRIEYSAKFN